MTQYSEESLRGQLRNKIEERNSAHALIDEEYPRPEEDDEVILRFYKVFKKGGQAYTYLAIFNSYDGRWSITGSDGRHTWYDLVEFGRDRNLIEFADAIFVLTFEEDTGDTGEWIPLYE